MKSARAQPMDKSFERNFSAPKRIIGLTGAAKGLSWINTLGPATRPGERFKVQGASRPGSRRTENAAHPLRPLSGPQATLWQPPWTAGNQEGSPIASALNLLRLELSESRD